MFDSIVSFIRDLYKSEQPIPLHSPFFGGNEKNYVLDCIDSTYVSSIGEYVDRFEKIICEYTGSVSAVACVNGTSALHIALLLAGVTRDDEVITQAFTFVATANAISYAGARPVFIDIDLETMGLSPECLKKWLSDNAVMKKGECFNRNTKRRIKACIPMHTFGHPAKIHDLQLICEEHNLELIEDAAESIGSFYSGKHTGTFGKIGVISFNGNKTITTGGGGMLLFSDKETAIKAKHLTTQSKIKHPWEFVHDETGYNYRMPNINAALGCAQMEMISEFIANKRETAELYKDFFSNLDEVMFVPEPENCLSNYWLNTILFNDEETQQRFLEYSNGKSVLTRPPWTPMNKLPMFKDCQSDKLTNTTMLHKKAVNIPSSYRQK